MKREQYEVVVIGAGPSGVAAATAAARRGARVALLERYGFCGGQAISAYVGTLCGLQLRGSGRSDCLGDFPNEFGARLFGQQQREPQCFAEGLYFTPYYPWAFEAVCDDLLTEAGVTLFLHASSEVFEDEKGIALRARISSEEVRFEAASYVDASAQALFGTRVCAEAISQAPAYVFGFANLCAEVQQYSERALSLSVLQCLLEAEQEQRLVEGAARLSVLPGSLFESVVYFKLAFPELQSDTYNEQSTLEQLGRRRLRAIFRVLRERHPLFRNAVLCFTAPQVGLRSGRRSSTEYQLQKSDVLSCRRFPHVVARACWPLERWGTRGRAELTYVPEDSYYEIPAESLCVTGMENVFVCGRGLGADEAAHSSARVIGSCLSTGYAAGFLAAAHAAGLSRAEAIASLQREQFAEPQLQRLVRG